MKKMKRKIEVVFFINQNLSHFLPITTVFSKYYTKEEMSR